MSKSINKLPGKVLTIFLCDEPFSIVTSKSYAYFGILKNYFGIFKAKVLLNVNMKILYYNIEPILYSLQFLLCTIQCLAWQTFSIVTSRSRTYFRILKNDFRIFEIKVLPNVNIKFQTIVYLEKKVHIVFM